MPSMQVATGLNRQCGLHAPRFYYTQAGAATHLRLQAGHRAGSMPSMYFHWRGMPSIYIAGQVLSFGLQGNVFLAAFCSRLDRASEWVWISVVC